MIAGWLIIYEWSEGCWEWEVNRGEGMNVDETCTTMRRALVKSPGFEAPPSPVSVQGEILCWVAMPRQDYTEVVDKSTWPFGETPPTL